MIRFLQKLDGNLLNNYLHAFYKNEIKPLSFVLFLGFLSSLPSSRKEWDFEIEKDNDKVTNKEGTL